MPDGPDTRPPSRHPKKADRVRIVIDGIRPQVGDGRRAAKATVGEGLTIEANAFADGHDLLVCDVRYRHERARMWSWVSMTALDNDRWRGELPITEVGPYRFSVRADIDEFATWRRDLAARASAGQKLSTEFQVGAGLLEKAASRAKGAARHQLNGAAADLRAGRRGLESPLSIESAQWSPGPSSGDLIFSDELHALMRAHADHSNAAFSPDLRVAADPAQARFSTWYEMFPRSASSDPARHGTFADVTDRLEYVARLGFDVLYLPPIHPIGRTGRKGPDGATTAAATDPGSPWAIGDASGGHLAIHPQLGTLDDFRQMVSAAQDKGIRIALDLAFQVSPDHPWVTGHPDWFRHLPDGSIRYAENPPKRYEDIFPLDFASADWLELWEELLGVVRFWAAQGVTIFRVDNPHTKPFPFWEWLIASIKAERPEVIFLAEAFTRPNVMAELARLGFSQSYTYFTWRSTKWELETYLTELVHSEQADYFRPNFWPNTPDILTEELQTGGRAAFLARLVLAATLSASYGLYGPAFELQEHIARTAGSEEYLHSEKYQLRAWDLDRPDSLADFVGRVNAIRHAHGALQSNRSLRFHGVDNDQLIAFSKQAAHADGDDRDTVVVVVNLNHHYAESGWVDLPLADLGLDPSRPYVMRDLLTDARYQWQGEHNFIRLDPTGVPAHIFSLHQPTEMETA